MQLRCLLIACGIAVSSAVYAQSSTALLLVKKGERWGFIDPQQNWVIPAQYEQCLPFDGRQYTWAKKDGKSFIINQSGDILSTLSLGSVDQIFEDIFIYTEDNLQGWQNRNTGQTIAAQYTDLRYLSAEKLLIAKDGNFSYLLDYQNNSVLSVDSITSITPGRHFTIGKYEKYGVADSVGSIIVPLNYARIKRTGNFYIAEDFRGFQSIYDFSGTLIYKGAFDDVSHLLGLHFQGRKGPRSYLLNTGDASVLDSTDGMYSLINNNLVELREQNGSGVYSLSLKRRIINPQYARIYSQVGSTNLITYDNEGLFGLVDTTGKDLVDRRYATIGGYIGNNSVCIVSLLGKYGLIGKNKPIVLPPIYSYISIGSDNVVKAKKDSVVILYEFDDRQQMTDSMLFTNVGTLRMGGIITMSNTVGTRSSANQLSPLWFQDDKGKWGLRDNSGAVKIKPIYDEVVKLRNTPLAMGKIFATRVSQLSRRVSVVSNTSFGLVNEQNLRVITLTGLLYVDTFALRDTTIDVLRVMNGGGYMATIHKKTGRRLNYDSKFIGPYVNGYARIFVGNKFVVTSKPKLVSVTNLRSYLAMYGLTARNSPPFINRLILDGLGHWAYIDREGKYIARSEYFKKLRIIEAGEFANNRAIVKDYKGYYGLINESGGWVLKNTYKKIRFLPSTGDSLLETVTSERRYGFVSTSGSVVSPVQYTKVLPFEDNHTWAFTDNMTYIIHKHQKRDSFLGVQKVSAFYNGYGGLAERRRLAIVDSSGFALSAFVYSRLGKYSEGLQPAKKTRVYGYLSDDGNWAIEPKYYKAGPFIKGVAMVKYGGQLNKNKYFGYIDTTGKLISGKYSKAEDINAAGYAEVRRGRSKGVVNAKGKIIVKPKYKKIYYSEGHFASMDNGAVILRDKYGKKTKKVRGAKIKSGVSDGKLVVKRLRNTGVIDTTGKKVMPYRYRNLQPFENGYTLTQYRRLVYIIHESGDTVASVEGRAQSGFRNGYALIRFNKDYYFYVNIRGEQVFNMVFQDAEPFTDGLAIVKQNDKYGMLDTDGYLRIKTTYNFIKEPSNGVSIVGISQIAGVCDLNANYIISPRANKVDYLPTERVYRYSFKNEYGYFTRDGKIIWEVK